MLNIYSKPSNVKLICVLSKTKAIIEILIQFTDISLWIYIFETTMMLIILEVHDIYIWSQ